ncbi:MAG: AI-2E family transporter [Candidatus Limimorpha sp.]
MNKIIEILKPISEILILAALIIFFPDIVWYFVISIVLFILGHPLCKLIKKIHIKRFHLNDSIAAFFTLLIMFGMIIVLLLVFIPIFNSQASMLSNINTDELIAYFNKPISDVYNFLGKFNLISSYEDTLEFIENEINGFINWTNIGAIFSSVISTTGNIFVGIFSVVFITFFMLREPNLIHNIFIAFTPEKHSDKVARIMTESKELLTRYIFGLIIEICTMMIIISTTLTIIGLKNALLIGIVGGMLNIIPYLGPLMGACIGIILGIISIFVAGEYNMLLHTIIVVAATFAGANLIDNFVLQPMIYSKSVKAHPIEIFIVILMAGKIAGIIGMIVAIPGYTLIRIVAKQFLSNFRIVEMLTKKLDKEG